MHEQQATQALAAMRRIDADVEDVRLARTRRQDAVTGDGIFDRQHPAATALQHGLQKREKLLLRGLLLLR